MSCVMPLIEWTCLVLCHSYNGHVLCYATHGMNMSCGMPLTEWTCLVLCHTRNSHVRGHSTQLTLVNTNNYAWWLLLLFMCLSGTKSSMNALHFYEVIGPSITR